MQISLERRMLVEEDGRAENPVALLEGLRSSDRRLQRIAARAFGRFERPAYADAVRPLLASADAGTRAEAVNAFGQMNASFAFEPMLATEKDGNVRAVVYETIGRWSDVPAGAEEILIRGLKDADLASRTGAAKGLEALFRLHARNLKPSASAIAALRQAIRDNPSARLRELALLALNAAGDADPAVLALALADPEPQVRRLAVIASKRWKDDPSHIVRYDALRVAGNCDRAAAALGDPSDHVALLAIDLLGNGCPSAALERIVDENRDWRRQARALVSLAKVNAGAAARRLERFRSHDRWQVRAYAAAAAKTLKDERTLDLLSGDRDPNVRSAAMSTPEHAVRALAAPDYGLVLAAARFLRGAQNGAAAVADLARALDRITGEKKATSRDPRMEILQRLREFGDAGIAARLRPLLSDFDPAVARLASEIVSEKTGAPVRPQTLRYETPALPSDAYMRGLAGATAHVRMKESGALTLQLLAEEAPATVAVFSQLAEKGYYNGLTIHRIAPNFVLQGGSPGANEYAGQGDYMRDETGMLPHLRGTLGISTRGRDTGDAQIFINLIDNFRLDHAYTVFARITEGMENADRIQEGDVIEAIEIRRKVQPR